MINKLLLPILLAAATVQLKVSATAQQRPDVLAQAKVAALLHGSAHSATGSPLAGAAVLLNGQKMAVTGEDGSFSLSHLPKGKFRIEIAASGYFPAHSNGLECKPGEPLEVNLLLEPLAHEVQEVVVTGTGIESSVMESSIRTDLISAQVMESQLKTTLAQALQGTVPGVRVETNCQNCGFTAVRLNGMEGPYTQILENGLPTYSGVTAVYGLEQIPTQFLERIEVVKGGSSSLYGPNAVAGVINLISKEPVKNSTRVDLMSSQQQNRPEHEIGASSQFVNLPGRFSANAFYRFIKNAPVDRDNDGFSEVGKRELNSGGFQLFRSFLGDSARLSFSATVIDEFRRGGDQFDKEPQYTLITEQIASRRYTSALTWNHTLTPKTFYELSNSLAYLHRDTYYGSQMDPNAFGNTRDPLLVSYGQLGHVAGAHTLLTGYQFNREFVDDRAPAYNRKLGGLFSNICVFVQDDWKINDMFSVLGGMRIDKSNQLDKIILSPRVGAKFALGQKLTARAALSTGFRPPAVFDEDLHVTQVSGTGMLIQNAAGLKEESSLSVTGGADYLSNWRNRRIKFGANFFWTRLSNNFQLEDVTQPSDTVLRYNRVNGTGAVVKGIEFDGQLAPVRWLTIDAGLTLQTSRMNSAQDLGEKHFFRSPDQYGYISFDLDLPKELDLITSLDVTGPMIVLHQAGYIAEKRLEHSQTFAVTNLVLSRIFQIRDKQQIRAYLRGNNLFDQYQPDLDKGPYRDSGYVYGPSQMRGIALGMSWQF